MKDRKFIKLQNQWYKKLRRSGFKDIEWLDEKTGEGHNTSLIESGTPRTKTLILGHLTKSYEFFYNCRRFGVYHQFERKEDKVLWDLYSDGVSYRSIIKLAKRDKKRKWNLFTISTRVNEILVIMGEHMRMYPEIYSHDPIENEDLEYGLKNEPIEGYQNIMGKLKTMGYNDEA